METIHVIGYIVPDQFPFQLIIRGLFMSTNPQKYRLVTRSDFDGLVCAVLLKELDMIEEIKFVHPKDMQDGKIDVTNHDITTNLPYVEGVYLAFDHHSSETLRNQEIKENHIIDPDAPSAARVVYNHFGGSEKFPNISPEMLTAVDKADSAQFTIEEVLHPENWVLLNFLMDARTGLGRFREFQVSNYQLMMHLIDYCKSHKISEILALPDVKERVDLYFEQAEKFKEQIKKCSQVHKNLVVIDLRNEEVIYAGNRFMIYAMFPECNISIHSLWGVKQQNTVFAVGKSIFNKTSQTNIGELMLKYGGGGHANAGTCQVDNDQAESVLQELIEQITKEG
jgi:nanoRNase/pAp phosphatase (c-di-AMP/oligoRNAs hydrolase)